MACFAPIVDSSWWNKKRDALQNRSFINCLLKIQWNWNLHN